MEASNRRSERVMKQEGVTYANRWAEASLLSSVLMLLVSVSSPGTPLSPFIVKNWLIFAPGVLLLFRHEKKESGELPAMERLPGGFPVAVLPLAVCRHV